MSSLLSRIDAFDQAAIAWMRVRRVTPLTYFFKLLTYSGSGRTWFSVSIALHILGFMGMTFIPNQALFLRCSLCALLAWAVGSVIKKKINRTRPSGPAIPTPPCQSFPSSHTSSAVAFYVALKLTGHDYATGVGEWALWVSFSRFYLGVHFPSDLAGGAVVGVACGYSILLLALA